MKMTMVEALNSALALELERDQSVVLFGEDIGANGGVFRVTEHLQKQFGAHPAILEKIQEAAKKHADQAPVRDFIAPTEKAKPVPPTPKPNSTATHLASWAALIIVLFLACRGLAGETKKTRQPSRLCHEKTIHFTNPQHIWPLSGEG